MLAMNDTPLPPRVLICDDDAAIREALERALRVLVRELTFAGRTYRRGGAQGGAAGLRRAAHRGGGEAPRQRPQRP